METMSLEAHQPLTPFSCSRQSCTPQSSKAWPLVTEARGLPFAPSLNLETQRCLLFPFCITTYLFHIKIPTPGGLARPCVTAGTVPTVSVFITAQFAGGRWTLLLWVTCQMDPGCLSKEMEQPFPMRLLDLCVLPHCPPGTWGGGPRCGLEY